MYGISFAHSKVAEIKRREAFRSDLGEYLPQDIWKGLTDLPTKYGLSAESDESASLPSLSKSVVEKAARRLGQSQ